MRRAVVLVLALALAGCSSGTSTQFSRRPKPSPTALPSLPGRCRLGPDGRPDLACTPGVLNKAVTQATIGKTICKPGWTATIRPPLAYTDALKRQQIAAYGYTDTKLSSYEEDHLVPLELGGSPTDPRNLWPEARVSVGGRAEDKDRAENAGKVAVCSGLATLAAAQAKIIADWGPAGAA
jgi:hypothetical protein